MMVKKKIDRKDFDPAYCMAYNKKGLQCHQRPIKERKVCRLHGGKTPRGVDHPSFKHGRYSKYLPAGLLEKYNEAQIDPDLLSLRGEITLLDARQGTLLEELTTDDGRAASDWTGLSSAWRELLAAQQAGNANVVADRLAAVDDMIASGTTSEAKWRELYKNMDIRRRLVRTEAKRLMDMQQLITAERATALVFSIIGIIRAQVKDVKIVTRISDDIRSLLGSNSSR